MGGHQIPEQPTEKQLPTDVSDDRQWRQREDRVPPQCMEATSTHIFVKPCHEQFVLDVQRFACEIVPDLKRIDASKAHISISRTRKSACTGIQRIYSVARQNLKSVTPFLVSFSRFSVYESRRKNKLILALDVDLGVNELSRARGQMDAVLRKLDLPWINIEPSLHLNVGWVPIQKKQDLLSGIEDLQKELDRYCADVEFVSVVDRLCLRLDGEVFEIPLGFGIPNLQYKTAD